VSAATPHVLVIGIDGIRPDVLAGADTPHLDALVAHGVLADDAETDAPTLSGPGWSSMLTGVWPEKHRVFENRLAGNAYAADPDFLTRLERADARRHTLAVASWPPLVTARDGGPLIGDAVDERVLVDGERLGYDIADWKVVATAVRRLRRGEVDAAFVYLGWPDVVGHARGTGAAYRAAIEVADRQVGKLLDALRARPGYAEERWLVLIGTDHGRLADGEHGGDSAEERRIFLLASGLAVRRLLPVGRPRIVDVAATALHHLGLRIDAGWNLDGRVLAIAGARS
jgi:predicted AlkP superfamily pyrophosphatase or phosphodiesterase